VGCFSPRDPASTMSLTAEGFNLVRLGEGGSEHPLCVLSFPFGQLGNAKKPCEVVVLRRQ